MIFWRSIKDVSLRDYIRRREALLVKIGGHIVTAYMPNDSDGWHTTHDNLPLIVNPALTMLWHPLDGPVRAFLDMPS